MRTPRFVHLLGIFFLETVLCKSDLKEPTVLVGILIRNKAHTLPYFFTLLERLDYPKDRMILCFRSDNNVDNSGELLKAWLDSEGDKYHAVDLILDDESLGFEDEEGVADWSETRFRHVIKLREEILEIARESWADYVFMLDADVFLTNPGTLRYLIAKNKTVVAPLVKSNGLYSNFWAGMGEDFYYVRTERYEPILDAAEKSCHVVPMVHSAVLINLKKLQSDFLTYDHDRISNYKGPRDDIIAFALCANKSGVELHICNDHSYGYIMIPLTDQDTLATDAQQLTNLKLEILSQQSSLPLSDAMAKFVRYPEKDELGFDAIYMINLLRRPERRRRMEQCFDELGIHAEYFDAIDGRTLDEAKLNEWGIKMIPEYADPYHDRPMTMGEIGCFLSHYVIWKKIIEHNHERAIVLEDDIRFEPFFRNKIKLILEELERLPFQWDLVYLGRKRMSENAESNVKGSTFLVHAGYSYWTLGYLISKSGAKKLVESKPLDNMIPVDEYLPIMFDHHPRTAWKKYFPRRDLVALSANPLLLYPTHYTGENGYVSDTENSKIIDIDEISDMETLRQDL